MADIPQWQKTTGNHPSFEAARSAYQTMQAQSTQRLSEDTFAFVGCAYADGTFDIGDDAYLTALWLFLEQQRCEPLQISKAHAVLNIRTTASPRRRDVNENARETNKMQDNALVFYPMRAVGGIKSKQRKVLKKALRSFRAYARTGRTILIEGCIWHNGDFAVGAAAYDVAQQLNAWHARGGAIPQSDLPRPFVKTAPPPPAAGARDEAAGYQRHQGHKR